MPQNEVSSKAELSKNPFLEPKEGQTINSCVNQNYSTCEFAIARVIFNRKKRFSQKMRTNQRSFGINAA